MFQDRVAAGRALARALTGLRSPDLVVVGLPRGGVPVAAEVARALGAPLDVVVVRKVGVPGRPELAMGAVGEDDTLVLNEEVVRGSGTSREALEEVVSAQRRELAARLRRLRGVRPPVPLTGRTVVVVDDGVATGATVRAACAVVRARGARRVVVATPVAPPPVVSVLRGVADDVVCLEQPARFRAVGEAYRDFGQVSDAEVAALLAGHPAGRTGG